jgi:hypothetical protein
MVIWALGKFRIFRGKRKVHHSTVCTQPLGPILGQMNLSLHYHVLLPFNPH